MGCELRPAYETARPGEVKHVYCTMQKSIDLLSYKNLHSLKEGLSEMVEWAREFGPQEPSYKLPLEITKKAPRVWVEKLV